MGLCHVCANTEKHLGVCKLTKRICHGPRAKRLRQTGDSGGVSGTCAVIDIIGTDHCAE